MNYNVERLECIAKERMIKMIVLFGSRAKEKHSSNSDLDLGVLFKTDVYDSTTALSDLMSVFPGYDLDLVILNHSDPVLNFEIISNYNILYCETPEIFLNFYINTVKQYNDIQKFLRQEGEFLKNYLGGNAFGVRECHPPQIN